MTCAPDLAALHDALGCATAAVVYAWHGERDSASLSLIEAHAAAEEAFGPRTPGADALDAVLAAIAKAAGAPDDCNLTKRPAAVPVTPRLA
jgi:hypothetical protein